ncbi:uncharacterized protein PGTG_16178 [Puccinia graminis f. sp. tritici CRL 75-36-700-3]|uniref:Uncharacterized protein n=1 Tax=Puccinia graminis f. sp. tritici (strain CRL 75-36-700-3 / race SCCL) TaxID=418459 RepID=E3L1J3_PUCGT|nr:uncharacterized protein PGTG_16178 [Puccinia graminis f. sp. tritici CRL 75-36-700-3]EFP90418.1 hypothetical protein PGTG_16178 [Puccinia graminis f. sp. tritici CRL 75-36-700-3]
MSLWKKQTGQGFSVGLAAPVTRRALGAVAPRGDGVRRGGRAQMPKNPPRRALPGAQGPGPQTARGDDGEGALGGPDRCRYARAMRNRPAQDSKQDQTGADLHNTGGIPYSPKSPGAPAPRRAQEDLEKARLGALSSKVAPPTLLLSLF